MLMQYFSVAQLLIQVTAEIYMGYTTPDAILVQDLWINNAVWNNDPIHSNIIERQRIATHTGSISDFVMSLRKHMVRGLCLGVDADLEWEGLPEHIRRDLVGRCTETSQPLNDAHMSFWNSQDFGVDFETHVARCNYAVSATALTLKRAISSADKDYSGLSQIERSHKRSSPLDEHRSLKSVRSIADLLKKATPPKYSVSDKVVHFFGRMYHFGGTTCKFFSIAFVADPEYQRELKCTLSSAPVILRYSASFAVLSIWMWAKAIQTLLLPGFLVSPCSHPASVLYNQRKN